MTWSTDLDQAIIRACDNMLANSIKGYAIDCQLVSAYCLVMLYLLNMLLSGGNASSRTTKMALLLQDLLVAQ